MRKTHLTHRRGGDPVPSLTIANGTTTMQVFGADTDDSMRTMYHWTTSGLDGWEPGYYPVCGAPVIPVARRKPGGAITCANCKRTKEYRQWLESMRETLAREEAA